MCVFRFQKCGSRSKMYLRNKVGHSGDLPEHRLENILEASRAEAKTSFGQPPSSLATTSLRRHGEWVGDSSKRATSGVTKTTKTKTLTQLKLKR